jgi:hypothetical protein
MAAGYSIEDHSELTTIGSLTHPQIEDALTSLDDRVTAIETGWHKFVYRLSPGDLAYEISPEVVRLVLPLGLSFTGALVIIGMVDGRTQDVGFGWQPSGDGLALEIFLPLDPGKRVKFLAGVEYLIYWLSP